MNLYCSAIPQETSQENQEICCWVSNRCFAAVCSFIYPSHSLSPSHFLFLPLSLSLSFTRTHIRRLARDQSHEFGRMVNDFISDMRGRNTEAHQKMLSEVCQPVCHSRTILHHQSYSLPPSLPPSDSQLYHLITRPCAAIPPLWPTQLRHGVLQQLRACDGDVLAAVHRPASLPLRLPENRGLLRPTWLPVPGAEGHLPGQEQDSRGVRYQGECPGPAPRPLPL